MSTSVLVWPSLVVVGGDGNVTMMPGASGTIPPEMLPDIAIPKVHKVADAAARSVLVSSGAIDEGEWIIQLDDDSWWLFDGAALHQAPVITPGVYALVDHTHAIGDVTGLADSLAGKASTSHSHAQSDVTGLVAALSGKAAVSHGHSASDIAAPAIPDGHVLTSSSGVGVWAASAGGGGTRPALATYDTEADLPIGLGEAELGETALLYRTGRIMRWSELAPDTYAWLEYGRIAPNGPAVPATSPLALDLSFNAGWWTALIVLDDTTTALTVAAPTSTTYAGGAEVVLTVLNFSAVERAVVFAEGQSFWQHYDGSACEEYAAPAQSMTQLRFRVVGELDDSGVTHAVAIEPEAWIRAAVPPEAPTEVPEHTHAAGDVLPGAGEDGQVLTLVDGVAVWADIPGDPPPAPEVLPPWIPAGSSAARATLVLAATCGQELEFAGPKATLVLEARVYDTPPF